MVVGVITTAAACVGCRLCMAGQPRRLQIFQLSKVLLWLYDDVIPAILCRLRGG